jgi:hypothetical protein
MAATRTLPGRIRRLAMTRLNVDDARCEALFASGLEAHRPARRQ